MNLLGSKTIETDRLILRATIESDLKLLWKILCIPEVNKYYLTSKLSPNWNEEKKWQYEKLRSANDIDKFQWSIVLKDNNECIGQISVHEAHDEDESINDKNIRGIGWFINPSYQRNGYATEAATAILDYMFNNVKISEIITKAAIDNPASWKLMEKLGFVKRTNELSLIKYTFLDNPVEAYSYEITKEKYDENNKLRRYKHDIN